MRAVICATALLLTCAVGSAQARPKPAVRATFPKVGTVGEPLKFKGRAVNAPTARPARLEERVGKHWRARKRARVSKKRRFTVSWKPSQAGLRTVRVSILRRNGTVLARTHRAV